MPCHGRINVCTVPAYVCTAGCCKRVEGSRGPPRRAAVHGRSSSTRRDDQSTATEGRTESAQQSTMAALVATHKAPWREALVLQPAPTLPTLGSSQLKLRVLFAGVAFPDMLSIEGSHGGYLDREHVRQCLL